MPTPERVFVLQHDVANICFFMSFRLPIEEKYRIRASGSAKPSHSFADLTGERPYSKGMIPASEMKFIEHFIPN